MCVREKWQGVLLSMSPVICVAVLVWTDIILKATVPCVPCDGGRETGGFQKEGGAFSPGQGNMRDSAGGRKLLLKIKIRK